MSKTARPFHRLSTKLIAGTLCILLLILGVSLFVNSKVIHRVYLRRQTAYVGSTGEKLEQQLLQGLPPAEVIEAIEASEKVLVVSAKNTSDPDQLSEELRQRFRQKGLGFQKFWLWEQDYATAVQKGRQFRLYRQDKLNYGILVEYLSLGPDLYAIALIVPDAEEFMGLINLFSIVLYAASLATALLLICFFVKRITNPLHQMEQFAKDISQREYGQLSVKTHDELETVAGSMNQMSRDIQQYQKLLLDKNKQMELLLDNVAHDLKTPISLIAMYCDGIRDQLDDGTFLDTISRQNTKMAKMVEQLLSLSRIGQKEYPATSLSLDQLLKRLLGDLGILAQERGLDLRAHILSGVEIVGNPELTESLLSNLLTNAVKYAAGNAVEIVLEQQKGRYLFSVSNVAGNDELDLERIWEPFYVGEASRNDAFSGTGIGLAIVQKIADQEGYEISCRMEDGRIWFEVLF